MKEKLTIEELEAQYNAIGAELEARKQAEKEKKEAKLKAEKESRYKEIVDTYNKFIELKDNYLKDYGYFAFDMSNKNNDSHSWFWNTIKLF